MTTQSEENIPPPPAPARRAGLFKRCSCVVPTWKGWVLILAILVSLSAFIIRNAYSFLAMNAPVSGGALVVEGWVADYTMDRVVAEFRKGGYDMIYVVGGPIEKGALLDRFLNYAELGKAVLLADGLPPDKVVAVPAQSVPQDRTFVSFKALAGFLAQQNKMPVSLHLVSEGAHSRRSRLMLDLAIQHRSKVGVTAVDSRGFNPKHWWATSAGFKSVLGECISYLYTRILFRPV